jgi:hypothetical protein
MVAWPEGLKGLPLTESLILKSLATSLYRME